MALLGLLISGWLALSGGCSAGMSLANRPLLLFGILLIFTGVQLVTLGLLAELQARTYHESQNKPTYAIREIVESLDGQAQVGQAGQVGQGGAGRSG